MRYPIKLPRVEAGCPEMISDCTAALNLSRIRIQIFSGSDALHLKYGIKQVEDIYGFNHKDDARLCNVWRIFLYLSIICRAKFKTYDLNEG